MKIRDRLILGLLSGIIANMGKNIASSCAEKKGLTQLSYVDAAAGFFLKKRDIKTFPGQLVGILADFSTAITIGIVNTYMLTNTGKDHWFLKGVGIGSIFWVTFYGFLGGLGKNQPVYPVAPRTALSSFLGHVLFGILSNFIVVKLGDESLFKENQIPGKGCQIKGEKRRVRGKIRKK
ncbi:MAG: hypothetical protein GX088_05460 [Clostridia bacterium]|nr:hypothetical protein [Clostridia bacterium]